MSEHIEIIDSLWFGTFGTIGIVKCHDKTTNEIKFYIGDGMGYDQKLDEKHIMLWGTKFHPENHFFSRNVAGMQQ